MHLAEVLRPDYQVKIIERNPECSKMLAELLPDVVVLQGDATNADIMLEENMGAWMCFAL